MTRTEASGAAFYSFGQNKQKKWRDGPKPKCDHCGKIGHIKSKCFEIIGYPENWDTRRTQRFSTNSGGQSNSHCARGEEAQKEESEEKVTQGHALHGAHVKKGSGHHELMAGNEIKQEWVLDSGASHHMTPLLSLLEGVSNLDKPFHITVPTGDVVLVEKAGAINLDGNITLHDVLFVPKFSCNLISVHKLTKALNCTVTYHSDHCVIQDQAMRRKIGLGDMHDGIYVLRQSSQGSTLAVKKKDATVLWHARMGHPSSQVLQYLSQLLDFSFDLNEVHCCDICHRSKQCRLPFALSNNKAENHFHLIHCDLWGRYHTTSHNGCHYFFTIVDDFTHGTWVYLMKDKKETTGILQNFLNGKDAIQYKS